MNTFSWRPSSSQVGSVAKVCLRALAGAGSGPFGSAAAQSIRCVRVAVGKCRYCIRVGESLDALAERWGIDWLQMWGANPQIVDADRVMAGDQVK